MSTALNGFTVIRSSGDTTTAPTLLLIHGFLDDASVWERFVDDLGGEVATVRYDLPGFGRRSGPLDDIGTVTLESLADEAGGIVAALSGPVIVVGQSMGTQIAELLAARHAGHVCGLVLLTPVPLGGTNLPEDVIAPFRALGGDPDAQRRLRAELSPHIADARLDRLTDIGAPATVEVVSHYVDVWNKGVTDAPPRSDFLGPVLIVRGGADGFVSEALVESISPRFDHADVKVVDKGGHWLHVEYPDALAAMVLDFTDSVAEVSTP
jgi:pimeloyl-ACP methyl ester carboxylesterase